MLRGGLPSSHSHAGHVAAHPSPPPPSFPGQSQERCRFLLLGKKVMKSPVLVAKQRNSVEGKPGLPVSARGLALPTAWRQGCLGPPSPGGGGGGSRALCDRWLPGSFVSLAAVGAWQGDAFPEESCRAPTWLLRRPRVPTAAPVAGPLPRFLPLKKRGVHGGAGQGPLLASPESRPSPCGSSELKGPV